jgi:hypothetical protein
MARMHMPGSYELGDSRLFADLGAERLGNRLQPVAPNARIGRLANLKDERETVRGWNDYLNELGRKNIGKGNARALGSVALTYVDSKELGRMVEQKQPALFEGRINYPSLLNYYRRIKGDYARFVQERSDALVVLQNKGVFEDLSDIDGARIGNKWFHGVFEVRVGLQNFGKCNESVVFEESDEEILEEEMHDTWNFLRSEGFDTKKINSGKRPHLSVFDAFNPIAYVSLMSPAKPNTIGLDPPLIHVNNNSPSKPI